MKSTADILQNFWDQLNNGHFLFLCNITSLVFPSRSVFGPKVIDDDLAESIREHIHPVYHDRICRNIVSSIHIIYYSDENQ